MLSLWNMLKGRLVGATVAGLLIFLGWLGIAEFTDNDMEVVTAFANAAVNFLGFVGYALLHLYTAKRKVENGRVAEENVDRISSAPVER